MEPAKIVTGSPESDVVTIVGNPRLQSILAQQLTRAVDNRQKSGVRLFLPIGPVGPLHLVHIVGRRCLLDDVEHRNRAKHYLAVELESAQLDGNHWHRPIEQPQHVKETRGDIFGDYDRALVEGRASFGAPRPNTR
jgi:hypothetical protein